MEILFSIHNLYVCAKQRVLLNIPKLNIPKGELVALIGANGAGKSTLLHAMLGQFSTPQRGLFTTTGDVRYHDDRQDMSVRHAIAQGKIAWVGQHEQFEMPLTVLNYALLGVVGGLAWYQHPSGDNIKKAKQLLTDFDLAHLIDKRITSLSGGEKQRLAIVRALMQNTDILLLDEPSNHLDIKHERLLFSYLRALVDTQCKSIVVVLHSLTNAHRHADTVIAMHQGKVLAQGTPDTVMTESTLHTLYDANIKKHQTTDGMVFI